jgi:hypothetical protein
VAIAFLMEPTPDKLQVNHKDGDRSNCNLSNLEWVTSSENVQDGFNRGRRAHNLGKKGSQSKASKPVMSVDLVSGVIREYDSAMDAVREGFRSDSICRACQGKIASHAGKRWQYVAQKATT